MLGITDYDTMIYIQNINIQQSRVLQSIFTNSWVVYMTSRNADFDVSVILEVSKLLSKHQIFEIIAYSESAFSVFLCDVHW